jgi:hypothetical protein
MYVLKNAGRIYRISLLMSVLLLVFPFVVYAQSNTDFVYYKDDNARFYIDVPTDWSKAIRGDTVVLTGGGWEVEFWYYPVDANVPIKEIADYINKAANQEPNISLLSSKPITIDGISGYYSHFKILNGVDKVADESDIEFVILLDNGILYNVEYEVPSSQFSQSKDIRQRMLSSIAVGSSFDQLMEKANAVNRTPSSNDKILIEAQKMVNDANYCGWQNMISNLKGTQEDASGNRITHTDPRCPGYTFNGR